VKELLATIEKEIEKRSISEEQIAEILKQNKDIINRRIVGGYASVSIVDREGQKIPIPALRDAVARFMQNIYYRPANVFHSDITVGRILPKWTNPETGETFKTQVDDVGWWVVCLTPETKIRTTKGYKQIKDIKVGDKVYTHLCGKSFPVINIMIRKVSEEISILYLGGKNIVKVTNEHPILTKRGWIKANEIVKGDVLLHTMETHNKAHKSPTLLPEGIKNGTIVKWVSKEFYEGEVYNLEVEKANSYSGKGIIFHNCEVRDDLEIANKVWDEVLKGNIRSFSIAGSSKEKIQKYDMGQNYEQINSLEAYEVTFCETAVNSESKFSILWNPQKAEI